MVSANKRKVKFKLYRAEEFNSGQQRTFCSLRHLKTTDTGRSWAAIPNLGSAMLYQRPRNNMVLSWLALLL